MSTDTASEAGVADRLVRAPEPQLLEAPSSWLSRLGLQQAASLKEVLQFVGVKRSSCLDLLFLTLELTALEQKMGTSLHRLGHSLRILNSIAQIDPGGRRFLLRCAAGEQFRFCPLCFQEQTEPHVPIHWRVDSWRYCPEHNCQMITGCGRCGASTTLPIEMISAGKQGQGQASLAECASCGKKLFDVAPTWVAAGPERVRWADNMIFLSNGRASLAALHTRRALERPGGPNVGLAGLLRLARRGLIPLGRRYDRSDLSGVEDGDHG